MTNRQRRKAITLLELIVTLALMSALVTAISGLLRTSITTFEGYGSDHQRIEAAHGLARHIVRQLRQAAAVVAISDPGQSPGWLVVPTSAGQLLVWQQVGSDVNYGVGSADDLLAAPIDTLSFIGLEASGAQASSEDEIRAVQITCRVALDREVDTERVVRCTAWLRTR